MTKTFIANDYGNSMYETARTRSFAQKIPTRIGDFGDIIAGRVLGAEGGFLQPIQKARYKEGVRRIPHSAFCPPRLRPDGTRGTA